MKSAIVSTIILFFSLQTLATHNKGGRITYEHVFNYTFKVTITTWTKTSSFQADRTQLDSVKMGDGEIVRFLRSSFIDIANDTRINTYEKFHTYPGPGTYVIVMEDPNRNSNINNIPNSTIVPFSISSVIVIDSLSCPVNSPVILAFPLINFALLHSTTLSLTAYDKDKDSLTYELVSCTGSGNLAIPGYLIPAGITINRFNGEMKWTPGAADPTGEYNFAVKIIKWRKGFYFGHIIQDFSTSVIASTSSNIYEFNTAGYTTDVNSCFSSTIQPGNQFQLIVKYSENNGNPGIEILSEIKDSVNTITNSWQDSVEKIITWTPLSSDIRRSPYTFVFRGAPNVNDLTYFVYVDGVDTSSCSSLISVPENTFNENLIRIYPVPSGNYLHFEIDKKITLPVRVLIYDISGKIVFESFCTDYSEEMDIGKLDSGSYLVQLDNSTVNVKKKMVKVN